MTKGRKKWEASKLFKISRQHLLFLSTFLVGFQLLEAFGIEDAHAAELTAQKTDDLLFRITLP
ncbi:hypothetical protein JCM19000A_31190 [Silvimonas sp. JCM 19000]